MKQVVTLIASVGLMFSPLTAYANDSLPNECSEPVAVTSPCTGVLLPSEAATRGLKCLTIEIPKLKAEFDFLKTTCESRESRYKLLLDAEVTRGDKLFEQLQNTTSMSAPKWHEHPAFWFAVGFVVASATTVGITYAVNNN